MKKSIIAVTVAVSVGMMSVGAFAGDSGEAIFKACLLYTSPSPRD